MRTEVIRKGERKNETHKNGDSRLETTIALDSDDWSVQNPRVSPKVVGIRTQTSLVFSVQVSAIRVPIRGAV